MRRHIFAIVCGILLCVAGSARLNLAQRKPAATSSAQIQKRPAVPTKGDTAATAVIPVDSRRSFVQQYCSGCHNDKVKSGSMTLTSLDMAHVDQNAELA